MRRTWGAHGAYARRTPGAKKGMTICNTNEFVQSQFLDGVLIVRYINKMGTNGGGGVMDGVALRRLQAILSGVEIPTRMQIFFSLIFVRIHTNKFIQLLYKSCSTNSYTVWFLYQFIHFIQIVYYEFIQRAASASCEGEVRAHLLPRPGRTRLPRR
jgi:hypothetical protein